MRNNVIEVKIGVLGGNVEAFAMTTDNTVGDLIEKAEISTTDKMISVNGQTVDASTNLRSGDLVILQNKEIKGGNRS